MQAINDKSKCKGESPDGTHKCGYRETCGRFMRPTGTHQAWAEFWKADDINDCVHFEVMAKHD